MIKLKLGFQDPATPIMEGIVDLHNHICFYLILVFVVVAWVLFGLLYEFYFMPRFFFKNNLVLKIRRGLLEANFIAHGTFLEIAWTLIPSFFLILIALPSFVLLYSMDEVIEPSLTLKVIGHQWYWSYEYSDNIVSEKSGKTNEIESSNEPKGSTNKLLERFRIRKPKQIERGETITKDSYMLAEDELEKGDFRLLEVDNPIVLPIRTHIRVLVTSDDVIHSWAVPSLGVKVDAVPGRLNQTSVFIRREGNYYGQCSEICGVNHGFMPILVKGVSLEKFLDWQARNMEVQVEQAESLTKKTIWSDYLPGEPLESEPLENKSTGSGNR